MLIFMTRSRYVGAWSERTARNGGVIPSNIGLDGSIGGECGGQWWGGCYGWGHNCVVPDTGERVWRSAFGKHAVRAVGGGLSQSHSQQFACAPDGSA